MIYMAYTLNKRALKSSSELSKSANNNMPRKMETPPIKEIVTTVSKSGTGAHVFVPKDWLDRKVRVSLLEEEDEEEK
jgi:hypothetical protein